MEAVKSMIYKVARIAKNNIRNCSYRKRSYRKRSYILRAIGESYIIIKDLAASRGSKVLI